MVGIDREILQDDASPLHHLEGALVSDHGGEEGGDAASLNKVGTGGGGAGGLDQTGEDGDGQFLVGFGQSADVADEAAAGIGQRGLNALANTVTMVRSPS